MCRISTCSWGICCRGNEMRGPFAREHFGAAKQLVVPPGASIDSMRQAHVQAALAHVSAGGADDLFLEFGVREGRMINFSSSLTPDRVWHGFDSFQGLPQDRRDGGRKAKPRTWRKGDYTVEMPIVRSNVRLHVGWFNSSLRSFLSTLDASSPPPRVAFCHMDADLYASTYDVLDLLASKRMLREGTVISFDELFGHDVVKNHEWKALQEVAAKWAFSYRFITWMLHPDSKYGRAAVRIEKSTSNGRRLASAKLPTWSTYFNLTALPEREVSSFSQPFALPPPQLDRRPPAHRRRLPHGLLFVWRHKLQHERGDCNWTARGDL